MAEELTNGWSIVARNAYGDTRIRGPYRYGETAAAVRSELESAYPDKDWNLIITHDERPVTADWLREVFPDIESPVLDPDWTTMSVKVFISSPAETVRPFYCKAVLSRWARDKVLAVLAALDYSPPKTKE